MEARLHGCTALLLEMYLLRSAENVKTLICRSYFYLCNILLRGSCGVLVLWRTDTDENNTVPRSCDMSVLLCFCPHVLRINATTHHNMSTEITNDLRGCQFSNVPLCLRRSEPNTCMSWCVACILDITFAPRIQETETNCLPTGMGISHGEARASSCMKIRTLHDFCNAKSWCRISYFDCAHCPNSSTQSQ